MATPLTLSSIIAAILRLFALYWAASGLIYFGYIISQFGGSSWTQYGGVILAQLAAPGAYFLMAAFSWVFAGPISMRVTSRFDGLVTWPQINPAALYAFGILLVGLHTTLSSLPVVLAAVNLTITNSSQRIPAQMGEQAAASSLLSTSSPCIVGIFLVIFAVPLGRKLSRLHPDPADPNHPLPPPIAD